MKILFILLIFVANVLSAQKWATPHKDKTLDKYCIECHIVYQGDFLPTKSWKYLFSNKSLKDHFGKKVVLNNTIKKKFLEYYLKTASDVSKSKIAKKVNRSLEDNTTPIRVSQTAYIKDKHEDMTKRMVQRNKDVKSMANCVACHGKNAKKGIYNEDKVKVPNFEKGLFGWNRVN
jgi:cytochrome c553